ncbi:MAG: alpha/beta fold hydrolase [Actinomycetia bacterium]|nr:alpha/beta fold hydrolase [Actinomycetes bacterium]
MTSVTIPTPDGIELEGIHEHASDSSGTLVLCHPHPQHGGTMRTPILHAIKKRALIGGLSVLRFNFRGVGSSTGSYDYGEGEMLDVGAAIDFVRSSGSDPLALCGWSFGASTALRWQAMSGSDLSYVGIAPPVDGILSPPLPAPAELVQGNRSFVVGVRDQFVDVDALREYAASIGARIQTYPSSDHFFVNKRDKLADDVVTMVQHS